MLDPRVFKAIAHPVRRDMLRRLRAGELSAGALADAYSMSKPSLSGHLKVLREAGLVYVRREGTARLYALNTSVAEELAAVVMDLLGHSGEESTDERNRHTGGPEGFKTGRDGA